MNSQASSCEPPGRLLALSAELSGAETVETAVARTTELVEAVFDQPVASVCEYGSGEETVTVIGSSAPPESQVDSDPGRIPASVVERSGERAGDPSADGTPEATVETDPRGSFQAEVLVPVGRDRVLCLGVTDSDGVDEAAVTAVEGIAANLEAALARIDTQGPESQRAADTAEGDPTALRRLNELTIGAEEFDRTIERLLSLGCDHFGLDTGILSRVDGDDYAVEAVVDATGTHEADAVYDLGETMCEATLDSEVTEPLAFADVAETDHRDHPAAESVRAYIAAPVVVDGETYGTVNFSMGRPRGEAFRPEEKEFVTLVAHWVGTEIDRRRRFEELERYETILEAVDDPVYALDDDGRFTFVNEAAKREFGYGREVIGERPSVAMADSDVERVQDQIEELLATGDRSATAEFELETADGSRKVVENRLALIGGDTFRGTAGVLRDVTARNERRRQLESFQRAIESARDGVAILDDEEYTYVDGSHVDMYGFESKEQLLGDSWRKLYDDEEVERLEAEAFPALESEGYWRGMVTGSRPDGSTFPAELSLTTIDDGRLVCTVRDETEREEREQELRLKERAMDEAGVGIQITDATREDNPLIYVNDGFERLTGYTREETLGRNPRFLQGDAADPDQVARLREAIDAEEPVSLELQNRRKDGTPYWSRISVTPVRGASGAVQNYIGIQQDVTERRERERQTEARKEFLTRIYELTTDPELTFEEKMSGLLEAGRNHLGLPYGFLTRIDTEGSASGTQTIVEGLGTHEGLQPGESGPLAESYCRRTIEQDGPMAVTHAAEAGWTDDPAYEAFELETYVGSEVVAGEDTYGTLCFASKEPRDESFDEFERSFISLAGQWAGYEIDRRNSREELRQQRERLELTLSGTNTGLAEWDLETDAVTWNETLIDIVGRDVDSIEEFKAAVLPEDRDRVQQGLETMAETGEPWAGEFRMVGDDGETVWLGTRATPTYDGEGKPVRVLATGSDISDRKEAERERRRNERRFESLFDDPGMLVGLLDTDGRLLEVNETAMEYVDATPEELRGTPFPETPWWAHSEELVADVREWIQRAAEGEYVDYEATHPGPDGDQRHVTGTVRPVTDESGTVRSLTVTGRDVTERKRQQRELQDRQRKLGLVLSNTDTSIAKLDIGEGTVDWDDVMGDNDIGSPETVEAFVETVHPEDRGRVQSDIEAMVGSGEQLDGEYRLVNEDGDIVWVAAQAVPITDENEETTGELIAIATDITDLKQHEEELAESQERYQTLLRAAPDPVFVADAETGNIVEVNGAAEELFGRDRDDIVGCSQTELHPEGDAELYQEAFERSIGSSAMISELPNGDQPKLRSTDGETVPVEINADTVHLPQGPMMYGVFRDISQRRERERELELKERAMDEATLGITISDPDREDNPLVYVNDGFVEQTGYSRADALGRNCRFLQADDRDQAALDDLRDAIAAEEATTVELRNYRKNGEQFWNRLSVTPVYDEQNQLTNYVGVQQDVTDEKTREQRLRALQGATRGLLEADDIDEATAVAVETLTEEFGFNLAGVYLREGDELVRTAPTEKLSPQIERVEHGETPLWEAVEAGVPVHYEDCTDIEDGVDRGETAASAYFPLGDHGVVAVGVTDPDRLGEGGRRLVEMLAGNLAAVLDSLEREASVRASERRYRSLAENIPNGAVLTFDADLEYRLAAGELLPELGLEESEVSGTHAGEVLPDTDARGELVSRLEAALDGERTDRRVDLRGRTVRVHVVPVDAGDGQSTGTRGLVLAQDVTDDARRERELVEERERFRLLTESVDEYAFVVVGEDGIIETWNESAEAMFGYGAETAVGMPMARLHPEADRESGLPERLLQQARVAGESAHEGWRVRADGSEFYADVLHSPLETDDGEFRGYATVVRDMTDRRRQRRRTERFVEESDDVVTIVDTDGTVTYASGSADRVLGYDPDDLVGENLFDYLHPDSREHAMKTFFSCVEDSKRVKAECRLESPDGGWLNVEGRCRNMLDDDAIDGVIVYLRNVTESKKRARRFESIFNQTFQFTGLLEPDGTVIEVNDAALEFGGIERDSISGEPFFDAPWWTHSEAVRDDVRDAIDRAASGEFVRYETEVRGGNGLATIDFSVKPVTDDDGEVSLLVVEGRDITAREQHRRHLQVMQRVMRHNMRNDLTKMRGWTQVMCEETDAKKRAEQFETIERILGKWERMTEKMGEIRQVLDSQSGEGSTAAVGSLVEEAVAPVREEYADATIGTDVSSSESAQVPVTLLDAVRELVENAAKASADATIEVDVARRDSGWVEVGVRDDGPGMPEMEADVLETGEETPLNHSQGLGLWKVRMVVTQAGGDVSVESTADGTEVLLRLPVERDAERGRPVETAG